MSRQRKAVNSTFHGYKYPSDVALEYFEVVQGFIGYKRDGWYGTNFAHPKRADMVAQSREAGYLHAKDLDIAPSANESFISVCDWLKSTQGNCFIIAPAVFVVPHLGKNLVQPILKLPASNIVTVCSLTTSNIVFLSSSPITLSCTHDEDRPRR